MFIVLFSFSEKVQNLHEMSFKFKSQIPIYNSTTSVLPNISYLIIVVHTRQANNFKKATNISTYL